MAGWLGITTANEIYDFLYRGVAISIGSNLYLRLLVEPSSRSGGGTETNYTGYARYEIARGASPFAATSSGRISNSLALAFGVATSVGNGQLKAFDVVDTPSGAFTKVYNGGPILPAKSIVVGKAPTFRAGSLIFTL